MTEVHAKSSTFEINGILVRVMLTCFSVVVVEGNSVMFVDSDIFVFCIYVSSDNNNSKELLIADEREERRRGKNKKKTRTNRNFCHLFCV